MSIKGFILILMIVAGAAFPLLATTTIVEDTKGAILVKPSADQKNVPAAQSFNSLNRDQVYVNITTGDGLLMHIPASQVVKYVFYLKQDTFPTTFMADDMAVVKAKLDEINAFAALSPAAANVCAAYRKWLQNFYKTESAKYNHATTQAAQQSNAQEEQADFDKKCDLMRLDLIANRDNIRRSEQIVAAMEPLAAKSQLLTDVLAKWNEEKSQALQLSGEGRRTWAAAQEAHPKVFSKVQSLKEIPDFPADFKTEAASLYQRLDHFRTSATYPQTITYCSTEIPAYFLLNQMSKFVEKIKTRKYEDAVTLSQKTFTQVAENQIVDPYKPIYATFKNYKELAEDFQSQFLSRLAKLKQSETDYTDTELLAEYQKLYDMVPDPKVAARMEQIRAKLNTR